MSSNIVLSGTDKVVEFPNSGFSSPVVSVCVQTYQHAPYIRQCLDSILMQETEFPFEILLGEDASSDGTRQICIQYAKKYPDTIRLFLHNRNNVIYVNGIATGRYNLLFNFLSARGEYIALCEGDDYWTDPLKLQKQIDYMESNFGCSLCVHAADRISLDTGESLPHIRPSTSSRVFKVEEVIEGGGGLFSTNSMLFRSRYIETLPPFLRNASVGDFPLTAYLALMGDIFYIDNIMSTHRVNVPRSWTDRNRHRQDKTLFHMDMMDMLRNIDSYTDNLYHEAILNRLRYHEFKILLHRGHYREALSRKYLKYFQSFSLKKRLKVWLYALLKRPR